MHSPNNALQLTVTVCVLTGALPEDHREERLSGPAVGALHHPERR